MRFVVTGGAGFIGSHLVEALLQRGDEVVVLDDFSTGRRENLEPFEGRFTMVEGSITDPAICREAIWGADFVLHQAAVGSVPRSLADPGRSHEVNATGTLNILWAARQAGVRRVVFAASSSAYGDTEELPKHEHMLPRPRSPYAVAKLAGEQYCRAFHASYGLETIALRYFNVFGPRQDPDSRYAAVVPLFITAALTGQRPTIFGDGEQTRDFTYIRNVVDANLKACTAGPEALGEVFNIGAGGRTSINRVWRIVQELTGADVEPVHKAPRAGDVRDSLASLERAADALGYSPAIDMKEGMRRTVDWYSMAPRLAR
jgi:nucleoside-diphosphate-sugar epimerase